MRAGHVYGLPFSLSAQNIIYNPAVFEAAEIAPPADFSNLYETLEGLKEKNEGITGFAAGGLNIEGIISFIWGSGGKQISF